MRVVKGRILRNRTSVIGACLFAAALVAGTWTLGSFDGLLPGRSADAPPLRLDNITPTSSASAVLAPDAGGPRTGQAMQETRVREHAAHSPAPETPGMAEGPASTDPARACEITMSARALVAAMVALEITADCLPDERFVLHHNGMMFSALTNARGRAVLTVPALSENAVFIAAFGNGETAVVQKSVEDLADFSRVVVQWRGDAGLGLHAREFGADYFGPGHVHREAAGGLADAALGKAGVLQRFGAGPDPLMVEAYTFPTGVARGPGSIALSVEAEITAANCDRRIEAQTIEVRAGQDLRVQNLTLAMPACDATGDFLVLKNMLEDMTLAGR